MLKDFYSDPLNFLKDKVDALEKENLKLLCKVSTLQGNMDAIMKIVKDLVKKDWEK